MPDDEQSLLFVYNADTGILSELKDYVHKMVSPATYECNLCRITYGTSGMKEEWKDFIENLGIPVEFLHRDEMPARHPAVHEAYPAAFIRRGKELTPLVTAEEINQCTTLKELMDLVGKQLRQTRTMTPRVPVQR